jgi:hypothetical protein
LGYLLALRVTPATEQDRAQVEALAKTVQQTTEVWWEMVDIRQFAEGLSESGL